MSAITPYINYVQYEEGRAAWIRHIFSTIEDVQYKQVNHQVLVQGGTTQEYFPMNELILLQIYQVKLASTLWKVAKFN